MNKFSIYQYLIILVVLVIGFVYALPNLYPTQPSIQVAYTDSGKSADQELLTELKDILHKSAKEEIQNVKKKYEIKDENIVLSNIGAMSENKGIEVLVSAYGILKKKHKNLKLILKDQSN